jgi:2-polyprenyl-3-methyl-5-hydroxy-6-metoxy-1,4-benzoquinol methylase
MDSEAVEQLYSEKASFYHRFFIDFLRYGAGLKAVLRRANYLRPGIRVLDAGCGTGILTRNMVEIARAQELAGITFQGFDLTRAMLDLFREWMARTQTPAIELRQANVLEPTQLPEDWKEYDLIVSSAMLEHLPKERLKDALVHLRSRLAPGGTLLVVITRKNLLMRFLIEAWWKANMYARDEIAGIFREAGLVPTFGRFPFPYGHLNLWGHVIEARRKEERESCQT